MTIGIDKIPPTFSSTATAASPSSSFAKFVRTIDDINEQLRLIARCAAATRALNTDHRFGTTREVRAAAYALQRDRSDACIQTLRVQQRSMKVRMQRAAPTEAARMRTIAVAKTRKIAMALGNLHRAHSEYREADEAEADRMLKLVAPSLSASERKGSIARKGVMHWQQLKLQTKTTKVAHHTMVDSVAAANAQLERANAVAREMAEVKQMTHDMVYLLEEEGETLSLIEEHIEDATDNVAKGNASLAETIKKLKQNRRLTLRAVFIGTGAIVLGVVLAVPLLVLL
tara:strand:- start:2573 stop:3430 length:858 start_codon:yes stop_codon:yes gene_type:complete